MARANRLDLAEAALLSHKSDALPTKGMTSGPGPRLRSPVPVARCRLPWPDAQGRPSPWTILETWPNSGLLAVLATYRRDGTVLLSPVWHEWREGGFGVVTSSRDVKVAHLRRDPRGTHRGLRACAAVPRNRGPWPRPVRHHRESASAVRRIASRYLGLEAGAAYAGAADDDLLIRLEPGQLRAWDFAGEHFADHSDTGRNHVHPLVLSTRSRSGSAHCPRTDRR